MLQAFPSNGDCQDSVRQVDLQDTPSSLPSYTQQQQQQQPEVMTDSPPPQYHPPGAEQTHSNDMEVDSVGSESRSRRATSVISMDDIEAAQALEGLRSEYTHTPVPTRASNDSTSSTTQTSEMREQEPLLSLITSHPLLSSAINSSMSVYTSSKTYSPKFKYGAEFLERNIGPRVVNTVGSVGRRTGVEGGIRWALQRRESVTANPNSNSNHDQAVETADIEKGMNDLHTNHTRRSSTLSSEPLPPYDNVSSPKYDELYKGSQQPQNSQDRYSWQNRLMISTSGLGVAMSEESLRSLTYCLTWLQWANTRIGTSVDGLKEALKEWDSSSQSGTDTKANNEGNQRSPAVLLLQIQQVKGDVLQTLKMVVDVVSKYAGGALPENARNLVRRHLTSLPQRFRLAFNSNVPADDSAPESDMRTRAFRVLVLAEEGLDMMGQVSKVVNDTLVSAENWCETLRRPKPSANNNPSYQHNMPQPPPFEDSLDQKLPIPMPDQKDDVEMDGMDEKS
ncbi:clock-controlled protein 8 [Arthroderma uncinatum]|uniref:clock-controlled protein 8 n=1 Tax=Arthroderma uncinatum TaxID=74035 RepID=UPI00144A827D|nr:clock-controlled protein 8 [Arthroderma uncinatum]KAF3479670.1 clock-controlled protein 8 [Arthroderma uncinatum]